jgi:hypothetical protein
MAERLGRDLAATGLVSLSGLITARLAMDWKRSLWGPRECHPSGELHAKHANQVRRQAGGQR